MSKHLIKISAVMIKKIDFIFIGFAGEVFIRS